MIDHCVRRRSVEKGAKKHIVISEDQNRPWIITNGFSDQLHCLLSNPRSIISPRNIISGCSRKPSASSIIDVRSGPSKSARPWTSPIAYLDATERSLSAGFRFFSRDYGLPHGSYEDRRKSTRTNESTQRMKWTPSSSAWCRGELAGRRSGPVDGQIQRRASVCQRHFSSRVDPTAVEGKFALKKGNIADAHPHHQ